MTETAPKVVITTRVSPRHALFLSRAFQQFGRNIVAVFLQKKPDESLPEKPSALQRLTDSCKMRLKGLAGRCNYEELLADMYRPLAPEDWLNHNVSLIETEDINGQQALEDLRSYEPDLVLVFGGTILKDDWVNLPRLGTINLHTGILPYYRGCNSTEYALYHERFDRVGASIHYIDKGVDTGPIISRHHVNPSECRSMEHLRAKIFHSGIEAIIAAASQSVQSNVKLPSSAESAADSNYTHADFHPFVREVTNLRLKRIIENPWPHIAKAPPGFNILRRTYANEQISNGIYILGYHAIANETSPLPWHQQCGHVVTPVEQFAEQMDYMSQIATPAKLSELPTLLCSGAVDKPYFAVTFDDGYAQLNENALPICEKHSITPTVFVCGEYAAQETVNYRILLHILLKDGYEQYLREKLVQLYGKIPAKQGLSAFTKGNYVYKKLEQAVVAVWREQKGDERPTVHASWNEIKSLADKGWEVGNHTLSHPILSALTYDQQKYEIEHNVTLIEEQGLDCMKWLCYPYGQSTDVNTDTLKWLDENPDWFGVLAKGGVNTFYSRTEWLRTGIASCTLDKFKEKLQTAEPF